jgi:uncharacterized RDD family membrane protein YckC
MSLPLSTTGSFKRTGSFKTGSFKTGSFKTTGAATPPASANGPAELENPFPGLRPFREDEEYLFFGREKQVDRMVDKLSAARFLAVVGTSGTGKSSLVNCGLKPALHRGLMAKAGTSWKMIQLRPGGNPMHSMAHAFANDDGFFANLTAGGLTALEIAETTLRMSSLGLVDLFQFANLPEGTNLLVVVDQFEELFRYARANASTGETPGGGDAIAFVNLLLETHQHAEYPIYIVLTMRSDFLGECSQFDGLPEAINESQYLVPRMTRDARRAAIGGPIGVAGAELSPVLLTRLVNDVGDNPDQLSILQHAINRTWAHWQHDRDAQGELSLVDYNAVGTMARALDEHADEAFHELAKGRQQALCEKVFKALTDKGTDARGIRRPMPLERLCEVTGATAEELEPVLAAFRRPDRSFLMPPAGEALEPDTVIDISHEILMRAWERLKTWCDEEARSARTYRRLAETAELYANGGEGLLRDPGLKNSLDWQYKSAPNAAWASMYRGGFEDAITFLDASKQAMDQEHAEAEFTRLWRRFMPYLFGLVFIFFLYISPKLSTWTRPVVMPRIHRLLKISNSSGHEAVGELNAPNAAPAAAKPRAVPHVNAPNPANDVFRGIEGFNNALGSDFEREQFRKRGLADTVINSLGYGLGVGVSALLYGVLWFGGKRAYRRIAFAGILAKVSTRVAAAPILPQPLRVTPGPVVAAAMPVAPMPEPVVASAGRRLMAGLIDFVVFMAIGAGALFAVIFLEQSFNLPAVAENASIFGLWLLWDFLYQVLAKRFLWKGTLGDLACGLSITGRRGGHPGMGLIIARYFWRALPWLVAYVIAVFGLFLFPNDDTSLSGLSGAAFILALVVEMLLPVTALFSRRRQTLYDLIAGTLVVRRPQKARILAYRAEPAAWA